MDIPQTSGSGEWLHCLIRGLEGIRVRDSEQGYRGIGAQMHIYNLEQTLQTFFFSY